MAESFHFSHGKSDYPWIFFFFYRGRGESGNKQYTFTAFSLLFLGKHNKDTAGRHLFFS
jgi:hypothetical protein